MKLKRREFLRGATVAAVTALASSRIGRASDFAASPKTSGSKSLLGSSSKQQIAMLVYPQFTALDLVGPHTFLAGLMDAHVHLVWKNKESIPTDRGNLSILPSTTMTECPKNLDVLFVPGGLEGTIAVMQDGEVLSFLSDRAQRARYVTSVCTGSLVLGAAGLLKGYRATSHWAFKDLLPLMGATVADGRVVEDRNRITGGGVTSGIDFGLTVAARMRGVQYAEMLQLLNEYNPHPPFDAGTPSKAGPTITGDLMQLLGPGLAAARSAAVAAGKHLARA